MFRRGRPPAHLTTRPRPQATRITFSRDDLAQLGKLLAAGRVILQTNSPVLARIKAAMTRVGVAVPKGL